MPYYPYYLIGDNGYEPVELTDTQFIIVMLIGITIMSFGLWVFRSANYLKVDI